MHRAHLPLSFPSVVVAALTSLGLLVGCTATVDAPGGGLAATGGSGPGGLRDRNVGSRFRLGER